MKDLKNYLISERDLGNQAFSKILEELNFNFNAESVEIKNIINLEDQKRIQNIFNKWGSDKCSKHNYEIIYTEIKKSFEQKFSDRKLCILEIGCGSNNPDIRHSMPLNYKPLSSLYALKEIFETEKIFGADIDENLNNNNDFKVFILDQFNKKSFEELLNQEVKFDLVIDDGVHDIYANFVTFSILFEKLSLGGFYLIEDVSLSLLKVWEKLLGNKKINKFYYLPNNKDSINKDCAILIEKGK